MRLARYGMTVAIAALLFGFGASAFGQEGDMPMYFKHAAWVCTSKEAYQAAQDAMRDPVNNPFEELRQRLWDERQCIYIEDDQVTDVVSPYIKVLETDGEMRHVSFVLKFETRHALLNRELEWVKFNGWTEARNLRELW